MAGTAVVDIDAEIQALIARSRKLSRDDMATIDRVRWSDLPTKRTAIDHVASAHNTLTAHLGEVASAVDAGSADEAALALAEAELAAAAAVLDRRVATHMRLAVLDGYRKGQQQRRGELDHIRRIDDEVERELALVTYARDARMAARFFILLADNPQKLTEFALSAANRLHTFHLERLSTGVRNLAPKLNFDGLGPYKELAVAAEKLFFAAQVCLATVSVVFAVAADTANWATAVSKATVSAGAPISLGLVASDKFVQRQVWSHLKSTVRRVRSLASRGAAAAEEGLGEVAVEEGVGEAVAVGVAEEGGEAAAAAAEVGLLAAGEAVEGAAAAAIEAPPVAVVLACAGLAMIAGFAVVKAFDFCIDWIFGSAHMPRTMYVPTAAVMAVPISASM